MQVEVKRCSQLWRIYIQSRNVSSDYKNCRRIIAEKNGSVNAFVHVFDSPNTFPSEAPLNGASIAIKDNIVVESSPTTCASATLKDFQSPFDATVVRLLRESGADIIGKTNCDEFGMGSLNIHSVHGPVINPFQVSVPSNTHPYPEKRSAGGSSGGSAAAVAAGMCYAAIGTDTGGSIRLPASYCGVVGLKPSYGLISRWGVVSFADSLDCVGILASKVSIVKQVFENIAKYDSKDPTAAGLESRSLVSQAVAKRLQFLRRGQRGNFLSSLRIGIPQEYFPFELSSSILQSVRSIISILRSYGATIVPVSLPSTSFALSAYYVLASAEASSNMARYDGVEFGSQTRPPPGANLTKTSVNYAYTRTEGFGSEVQKRILLGTYALSADAFDNYFLQAQRVRQLIKDDFNHIFTIPDFTSPSHVLSAQHDGVDVLIHPSAIHTAPLLSDMKSDSLDMYVQDVLTVPASLAGLPAMSVPIESENNWPIGVSVVGQWGCDDIVLAVGDIIEDLQLQS